MERQSARVPMNCDVDFKRHGDARYRVELFDLSPQGCCLSPPIRVDEGDSISLRIPDMAAIHGHVAWVQGFKAGVRFDQPFHQAVFDSLVRRLGAA
ncbi:PilZ domain-containing protein [Sphingomonas mesophila]|uniref:PilZ domain-containing protein n=1 Tax=Sphingomonas mesophila TaxID=2303576 RepID=UPI0013C32354|nr:PilZ domain-containing protein [Sphingomonas mesophila]